MASLKETGNLNKARNVVFSVIFVWLANQLQHLHVSTFISKSKYHCKLYHSQFIRNCKPFVVLVFIYHSACTIKSIHTMMQFYLVVMCSSLIIIKQYNVCMKIVCLTSHYQFFLKLVSLHHTAIATKEKGKARTNKVRMYDVCSVSAANGKKTSLGLAENKINHKNFALLDARWQKFSFHMEMHGSFFFPWALHVKKEMIISLIFAWTSAMRICGKV